MRQARLILVTGLPGTGKSTLAREVAARYRIPPTEPVRIARLKARANDPSRHAGHRDTDLATAATPTPTATAAAATAAAATAATATAAAATAAEQLASAPTLAQSPRSAQMLPPTHSAPTTQLSAPTEQPPAFLNLPGERLVFDSDAQSRADVDTEQIKALLQKLDRGYL